MTDVTKQEIVSSSMGTTPYQESVPNTFMTSTTAMMGSSGPGSTSTASMGTSSTTTSLATSRSTSTLGTTFTVQVTDTTIPYIRETNPPEVPITTYHQTHDITEEDPNYDDMVEPVDHHEEHHRIPEPEQPMPEPETEPPIYHKPPPPPPAYNPTLRPGHKHKPGRINSETEERTAMIIGIVAGKFLFKLISFKK